MDIARAVHSDLRLALATTLLLGSVADGNRCVAWLIVIVVEVAVVLVVAVVLGATEPITDDWSNEPASLRREQCGACFRCRAGGSLEPVAGWLLLSADFSSLAPCCCCCALAAWCGHWR